VSATALIFFFQLVCFLALLLLMHRMYQQLRTDRGPLAPGEPAGIRSGVNDLIAELRETATQINGDMAARAATLQKLVDEANQLLRQLDAAAGRAAIPARRDSRSTGSRPRTVAPVELAESVEPRRPPVPTRAARPESSAPPRARVSRPPPEPAAETATPLVLPEVRLPRVTATTATAASAYRTVARPAEAASGFVEIDPADTAKFQVVRRLADQGLSVAEIARESQLGREEVELIMRMSGDFR